MTLADGSSYEAYLSRTKAAGNTPLTAEAINTYISLAMSKGLSMSDVQAFIASNPGDYARLTSSLEGYEVPTTLAYTGAGNAYQTIKTIDGVQTQFGSQAIATVPPILPATTGGDPRMFLSLSNLPTGGGGGYPARELAPYVGSTSLGTSIFGAAGGGGLNLSTLLILLAIGGAAWYLLKK